jgi:hypothetical protein
MELLDARDGRLTELSPLFHYWHCRRAPDEMLPLTPRHALQVASARGICARALHDVPFDVTGAMEPPTMDAMRDASQRRLAAYNPATRRLLYRCLRPPRVEGCRSAIALGSPVLLAFWMTPVYHSLSSDDPVHGLPPREPANDGHAAVIVGYDDNQPAFVVQDSRGAGFGRGGSWLLPYRLMDSPLIYETWALEKINYNT